MAHSVFDTMHPAGKLPPTLTPTGHFAGKPTLPISRAVTLIGSRKQARLQLISSTVSQNHSLIINADSGPYVRDLASREHTLVNGIAVTEGALSDGDEIQIGRFTFRFNESPQTQPTQAIRQIRPAPVGRIELDGGVGTGGEFGFEGKSLLIGRRDTCDVVLPDESVSTTHAIVFEMDGRRYIRDLASRTGTFINGKQIHQVELMPGDEIRIGGSTMRYAAEDGAAEETFAPPIPIPTDLGADAGDLELDTHEADLPPMPARPTPQPKSAARPAAVAVPVIPPTRPRPAPAGAEALELVQDQPEELEPVELAPADLEASKDEADAAALAPGAGAAAAANAAASQGELSIEHLDIDDRAAEEVSVDDLLGLEPLPVEAEAPPEAPAAAMPTDERLELAVEPHEVPDVEAVVEVAESDEQPAAPTAPAGAGAPLAGVDEDEIALSPLDVAAPASAEAPAEHEDRDLAAGTRPPSPGETVDATALGLQDIQPPVGLAPVAGSERFAPGASQLDLTPHENVEAAGGEFLEPAVPEARDEATSDAVDLALGLEPQARSPRELETKAPADVSGEGRIEPVQEPVVESEALEAPVIEPSVEPIAESAEIEAGEDEGVERRPIAGLAPLESEAVPAEPEPVALEPVAPASLAKPPAPLVEAVLDQDALSGPADRAADVLDDAAPDETFDTIEARSGKAEMDFAGSGIDAAATESGDAPALAEDFGFGRDLAEAIESPEGSDSLAAATRPGEFVPTIPSAEASDIDLPPVVPLPKVSAEDVEELEFAGADRAEAEAVPADVLEPFDESAVEVPPLGLPKSEAIEPEPLEIASIEDETSLEPPPPAADEAEAIHFDADEVGGAGGRSASGATRGPALADTIVGEQTPVFDIDDLGAAAAGAAGAGIGAGAGLGGAAGAAALGAGAAAAAGDASAEVDSPVQPKVKPKRAPRAAKKKTAPSVEAEAPTPVEPAESKAPRPRGKGPSAEIKLPATPPPLPPAAPAPIEVLAPTESTPESALPPLPVADAGTTGEAVPPAVEEVALTDTGFGRAIEELAGESKPIIEDRDESIEAAVEPLADRGLTAEDRVAPSESKPLDDDAALDLLSATEVPAASGGRAEDELTLEPLDEAEAPAAPVEVEEVAGASDLTDVATPAAAAPAPTEDIELEPVVEVEPLGETEALEEPPVVSAAAGDEVRDWGLELEDERPSDASASAAPAAPPPLPEADLAVASAAPLEPPPLPSASSRYAPGASQLELEPVDEDSLAHAPPGGHAADADLADLELEPVAEAPEPVAPIAPPPPLPPAAPAISAPAAAFNWGANQEHFLGGMPLKLGGGPTARSAPPRGAGPHGAGSPGGVRPSIAAGAPGAPIEETRAAADVAPGAGDDDVITNAPPIAGSGGAAASTAPFASEPGTPARPQPRPPQRPQPRPAPRRAAPTPFAGGGAPAGGKPRGGPPVATGFDGLAMPPVRETDVFAPMPGSLTAGFAPGLMDDVFGGNARRTIPGPQPQAGGGATIPPTGAPPIPAAEPPRRQAPAARRASKAEPPGDSWSSDTSPTAQPGDAEGSPAQQHRPGGGAGGPRVPAAPAAMADEAAAPRKKRRWFGLRLFLLVLLLPCAVAAAWGTYQYMPNRSSIRGELRFANFQDLPVGERNRLQAEQQELLGDEKTREIAKVKLSGKGPQVRPGFLADGLALARVRSEAKINPQTGALEIPLAGASGRDDQTRMLALLDAMYDANQKSIGRAGQLGETLKTLTRERTEATRQLDELKRKIDQLATTAQSVPAAADRATLDAEAKKLQAAWTEADLEVTRLAAQLKRLEDESSEAAPASAPAPAQPAPVAAAAATSSPATDEELKRLENEIRDANDRIAALREGKSGHDDVAGAREAFTTSLDAFDKSLASAQVAEKGDSKLAPQLLAAQKLLEETRRQADEYVKRLSESQAKLAQNQAALDEKLSARKAEIVKRDPELARLLDQKDITTRQYNTAVAQNLAKEAAEIKAELNLLDSMISARKTQVADDGFSADAIDQLQRVVEATRKEMDEDRVRTMQSLGEAQAEAARAAVPAAELSAGQQQVSAALDKQIAEVASARKQYADAIAAAGKASEEQVKALQASVTELANQAQARREQLGATAAPAPAPAVTPTPEAPPAATVDASAERKKQIEQKTAELASAQQRRGDAEAALSAARAKLLELDTKLKTARAAGEERDRLMVQRDALEQDLQRKILHYEQRKKEAELLPYPEIPNEANVKSDEKPDQRPIYSLAAGVGVMALFVLGMMVVGGSKDAPPVASRYADELPDYASEDEAAAGGSNEARDPRGAPRRESPVEV